jgi:protein TonB
MLPDPKFAHAATESPVIGGHADTRYLTIVYGMIRDHYREPRNARAPTREGAIMLGLDEGGNLVERKVVVSSGSAALDMAMMNAIAEAAPYPAPPGYQPMGLRLLFPR